MIKEQLFDALLKSDTAEAFLNYCALLLNQPIWLMDESFGLLAMSQKPSPENYYQQYFKNMDQLDERIQEWIRTGFITQVSSENTVFTRIHDELLNVDIIACDIRIKKQRAARLTIFLTNENSVEDEVVLDIVEALAILLRGLQVHENRGTKEQLLLYLISEETLNENKINHYCQLAAFQMTSPYQIAVIDFKQSSEVRHSITQYLNHSLRQCCPQAITILYEQRLVVLFSSKNPLYSFFENDYQYYQLKVGFSYEFYSLNESKAAFKQALAACTLGSAAINDFQSVKNTYLLMQLNESNQLFAYAHPKIKQLMAYDEEYHTHYLETLEAAYIQCNTKEACANYLNVHLNTVKYRLNQIKELFDLDLNQRSVCIEIQFSLLVLKYLEKLS